MKKNVEYSNRMKECKSTFSKIKLVKKFKKYKPGISSNVMLLWR